MDVKMILGARGILIKDGRLLLMKRVKKGKLFYTIPGGKFKSGEDLEAGLRREFKEETSLDISIVKEKVLEYERIGKKGPRLDTFFTIEAEGSVQLGGPEVKRNSPENQYILEWVELSKIGEVPLRPIKLRKILEHFD